MFEEKRYPVVDRYKALSIGGQIKELAIYFAEIEVDYPKWEDLKNIQKDLPQGILKRMVVQLMARASQTLEQLDATQKLCDKYNPGPAVFIEKRKKEFNSSV